MQQGKAQMKAEQVALLVLAGGRSQRFGRADKLMADLNGLPLGLHLPQRLASRPWAARLAVASGDLTASLSQLGFTLVAPEPAGGMGDNIARGIKALPAVDGVLICLADMPFVTMQHIDNLLLAVTATHTIAVSEHEGQPSPPVLFEQSYFKSLAALSGDTGARDVLMAHRSAVVRVPAAAETLIDIDTPDHLRKASGQ
jgi:molybdenum cofactor cytidylyltransferase